MTTAAAGYRVGDVHVHGELGLSPLEAATLDYPAPSETLPPMTTFEWAIPVLLGFEYPHKTRRGHPQAVFDETMRIMVALADDVMAGRIFPLVLQRARNEQIKMQNSVNAKVAQRSTQGIFERGQRVELANVNWRIVFASIDLDTKELMAWFKSKGFRSVRD